MFFGNSRASDLLRPWWDVAFTYVLLVLICLDGILLLALIGHGTSWIPGQYATTIDRGRPTTLKGNGSTEGFSLEWEEAKENSSHAVHLTLTVCLLAILAVTFVADSALSKMFYTAQLVKVVGSQLERLPETGEEASKATNKGLDCIKIVHHSFNKCGLWRIFCCRNYIRLPMSIVYLGLLAHFFLACPQEGLSSDGQPDLKARPPLCRHDLTSLVVLKVMLISLQCLLCLYSVIWQPWIVPRSCWGKLMTKYSGGVAKIDVARGRSVPCPPYSIMKTSSGLSSSPPNHKGLLDRVLDRARLVAGMKRTTSPAKSATVNVVEMLNPYAGSPDVKLVLDLVAVKAGVGMALKCLCWLEADVQNNWKPLRPVLDFVNPVPDQSDAAGLGSADPNSSKGSSKHLCVSWRDPLAVLYMSPAPRELHIRYGIEITFLKPVPVGIVGERMLLTMVDDDLRDKVVDVVGYDETRFFRTLKAKNSRRSRRRRNPDRRQDKGSPEPWHVHVQEQRHQIESGSISSYSVLGGGGPAGPAEANDNTVTPDSRVFVYQEEYPKVTESDGDVSVSIWTVVDGQLIARTTVKTGGTTEETTDGRRSAASGAQSPCNGGSSVKGSSSSNKGEDEEVELKNIERVVASFDAIALAHHASSLANVVEEAVGPPRLCTFELKTVMSKNGVKRSTASLPFPKGKHGKRPANHRSPASSSSSSCDDGKEANKFKKSGFKSSKGFCGSSPPGRASVAADCHRAQSLTSLKHLAAANPRATITCDEIIHPEQIANSAAQQGDAGHQGAKMIRQQALCRTTSESTLNTSDDDDESIGFGSKDRTKDQKSHERSEAGGGRTNQAFEADHEYII